ncbi:methyltransferase domain-containing protein [Thermodesulfovibrio sp.]|uniref:class I SAM-dependent methyltransferase n=1 Tax=Thermodesulfovibrio sp. TaxID=2067987 RepID=UPI0030B291B3
MFQKSQDKEYLELCIERAKNDYLTWVEQFLDIIGEAVDYKNPLRLNDIGCNLGQFWKGLKKRGWFSIEYFGYDCEEIYLEHAKKIFPEISQRLFKLDINREKLPECDITVCSATLEHLEYLQPALDNMLQSTKRLILLRTFLGETPLKSIRMKEGANTYYNIHQFSFNEIFLSFEKNGFSSKIIRDKYTDSMPQYIGNGIIRTFYIVIGTRIYD